MTKFTKPIDGHWSSDEGTEMANRYVEKDRTDLAYGQKTDLELANAIYMVGRGDLELIGLQTAAKERIRWLSAQLAALRAHNSDSAEPVAWLHKIKEPDMEAIQTFSWSPANPWSHWLNEHMEQCSYSAQPLYLASPPAKEVEITDVRIEQIARSYHDRTGDNETVDWDKCKSRYRTQVRKMVRNVLGCAALTNRTPNDEVGNG